MQHDAIVIGGSFAGLSVAIHLARARRDVCIIDDERPRNRFADAAHGFFGHDGAAPLAMIATARAQLRFYPTVTFVSGIATEARRIDGGFEVTTNEPERLTAARLVLAFGVSDTLPEVPGLADRWGRSVLHCPYCHGFEYSDRRLGVLQTSPMSSHQAMLIAEWGPTTLYLNGHDAPDADTLTKLYQRGVAIEPAQVSSLVGTGTSLSSLRLEDGRQSPVEALYLVPHTRFNSSIAEQLGCAIDDGPFGQTIRTNAAQFTTVPGVFAAGDIARAPHNATWASADGVTAGVSLHQSLVFAPSEEAA